jgi:hypothetical protein
MDQNPPITGLRALVRKVALEKAIELSAQQAHEIWRVMQIVSTGESFKGLPGAAVQYAMNFHQIPDAWKVIEEKALIYERNISKRKT